MPGNNKFRGRDRQLASRNNSAITTTMRGLHADARKLKIPEGARLVWSDEENKMVWRVPGIFAMRETS